MKIAIPTANGVLTPHFGHCEQFSLLDIDAESRTICTEKTVKPPAHEPGVLPRWLAEQEVTLVIAGGMGQRAQQLFSDQGIKVIVGAPAQTPSQLVKQHLNKTLTPGINLCDH